MIHGVRNFREVTRFETPSGPLRRGRLFRSGALNHLTAEGRRAFDALGVTDVVDLRSPHDFNGNLVPDLGPAVVVHQAPIETDPTGAHPIGRALRSRDTVAVREAILEGGPASLVDWMRRGYERLALEHTQALHRAVDLVARADGGVVVNCAAGKDRTGWTIALVLLAVGVDVDDVTADFLLSNESSLPAEVDPEMVELMGPIMGVRAEYLHAALDAVGKRWSTLDRYLEEAIGIDDDSRERLRRSLLEPRG